MGRTPPADEAVTVHIDRTPTVRIDRRALAAGDTRIDRQCRRLAGARQIDRRLRGKIPGVVELQIGEFVCHEGGVGQTVARIGASGPGDRQGGLDRRANPGIAQVAGAGIALLLPDVDRDAEIAVLLEFETLDLALADTDGQPTAGADARLGLGRAGRGGMLQRQRDARFEFFGCRQINS